MNIVKKISQIIITAIFCFFLCSGHIFATEAVCPEIPDNPDPSANSEPYNEDTRMYSLDEYMKTFSQDMSSNEIILPDYSSLDPGIAPFSYLRYTSYIYDASGNQLGTVALDAETAIIGGRPQFVYDKCYLGHPSAYNGWPCVDSSLSFSGDRIVVYATFSNGYFQQSGSAVFYPQ